MRTKNFLFPCLLALLLLNPTIMITSAHVGETHTEETEPSSSISVQLFIFVNLIIVTLSLGLVFLVNRYQQNIRYVSPKTMIIIIISTLLVNAIVAINTYVEVD